MMMPNKQKHVLCVFASVVSIALAGCVSTAVSDSQFRASDSTQGHVAVLPNYYVIVDPPAVVIDHGSTSISGSVHRKPGIRWTLVGRVDIDFIGPDGAILDQLPALLSPRTISMDPNLASTYSTTYGYVPPAGSTIRVHFVDADTQAREDLEGMDFYNGTGGNAVHTGGGHAHGGGHRMR